MCEAIGSDPLDEEIPPDFDELLYEGQMAIILYNYFPDQWSGGMSSFYVGKSFINIEYIFSLFGIGEGSRLPILNFMLLIDQENARTMNEKLRQK